MQRFNRPVGRIESLELFLPAGEVHGDKWLCRRGQVPSRQGVSHDARDDQEGEDDRRDIC